MPPAREPLNVPTTKPEMEPCVGTKPGTTIVVDRDPDAGLEIHAAEPRTPVEAR